MTGNAASSRRSSADTTGLEQTHLSAYHHTLFRPLTMMTDQVTASGAVALTNGPRLSTDQESVHPFQLDPEPRLSFDNNNNNARRTSLSSPSSLSPPFSSASNPTSAGESWLSLAPPSSSSTVPSSDFAQSAPALLSIQTQVGVVPHKTIRKKTSLASKIRKVFIKQTMSGSSNGNNTGSSNGSSSNGSFSSKDQDVDILHHHHHHHCSTQTLEDIMSTSMSPSSHDGEIDVQGGLLRNGRGGAGIGVGLGAAGELCPPPASHLIEHRGSVSSSSSGESVSVGQGGGLSPCTPSTSPEMSPSGSPKPKHATSPLIIGPSTAIADGVPYGHPLSPVEINRLTVFPAPIGPSKPAEKRMSLEPTSSRTSKKRLSFASITSFFNARNADAMAASNKKKQQRSSSVPNVESPLTDAGRQQQGSIAFQRRHSLNDLETGPQLQAKFAAPPWDKDRVSAQAAAAAAAESLTKATESETSSGATTMSKIQGVFGKQSKKNKSKKSTSPENAPTTTIVSSAKPLRSALAHRPVRAPSVRKLQVVHGYQGSIANSGRRLQHHHSEPLVNLSQEPFVNNNNSGSRRNSEEHSHTGPTRHRRQSSIAGRQASQQGHYPQVDRKQRLSVRYSSSEEYDIHPDLYTLDQHQQQQQQLQHQQQQQQLQHHGGYDQYDRSTVPQTPRINPLLTKPMTPQANDPPNYPLVNISPCTSRGAVAEGSFTFSPTGSRRRDSYISCSGGSPSKDTSPKLPSASTPRQQQNYPGTSAAIGNPHRRSSYDTTTNNRRSSFEANSRRNSVVVTPSISLPPPPKSAPVARLSVDHTLMSDHPGPSSPSAYPQAIAANGNHQHAIFANHQQQQQLQIQQQLHYQQFQRTQQQQHQQQHHHHHQMQYAPGHHQHHHHYQQQQQQHQQQQQFMTPHAGSQVFHEQYHTHPQQPQQQQSYQYSPYPYQYNMQQPLPSHLCYTSVQHPTLAYTGVSSTNSMQPPPPLQYSTSKSSGSCSGNGSGGNPSPTSWSSISPSQSPPTPPRSSRQFHFSTAPPMIHETWTPEQYDRTSDPNITAHRLTPAIAQRIKLELNQFKSQEMLVHQESRVNTHFFA